MYRAIDAMSDGKQDCVWLYFVKTQAVVKAIWWATFKKCGKEMQGLILSKAFKYNIF